MEWRRAWSCHSMRHRRRGRLRSDPGCGRQGRLDMDRELLTKWWGEAWDEGLWAAAWGKAIDGLTAKQAATQPAPGRKSIWQIVNHMIFWRENHLAQLAGKPKA